MSQTFLEQVDELVRARYTLIYVVTWEEQRARALLAQIATHQRKTLYEWSITDGLRSVVSGPEEPTATGRQRDPMHMLNTILQAPDPALYLLKDFHKYLEANEVVRQLRDLEHALRHTQKTVILISPQAKIPDELDKCVTLVDLPFPSYDELRQLLENKLEKTSRPRFRIRLNEDERDALIKAAQGLTLQEAENAFAKAIIRDGVLDARDIQAIIDEKKQVIRKSGLLEYYEGAEGLGMVGGMDILKDWLQKRVRAFTEEARAYGLPAPRGMLLLGVQGCGKSLVAKSVAASWQLPLLRMDVSRIFQGYIGSSEDNMRRALAMAETLAPVILWIDEIEKALAGVEGSSSTDAGTTARVVGQFLTWLQEKTAPVFVVATANSIRNLPPELLRKGRLDEIFFVDLPRARERAEVLEIHLRRLGRKPEHYDLRKLAEATRGLSGSEIEQAIISAMHDSFFERRELETSDILQVLDDTVPLSRTMQEDIQELRMWAGSRARPVSSLQRHNRVDAQP